MSKKDPQLFDMWASYGNGKKMLQNALPIEIDHLIFSLVLVNIMMIKIDYGMK